jgi:hypothetical protein
VAVRWNAVGRPAEEFPSQPRNALEMADDSVDLREMAWEVPFGIILLSAERISVS